MPTVASLLGCLEFEPAGSGRYRAQNMDGSRGVVFGGQLLAQTVAAASIDHPDKRVKTVHTVFARGGAPDQGLDITIESMHSGRAFASSTVTISQGDRLCTRSLVLLSADEPDLIRHSQPMPPVGPPSSVTVNTIGDWDIGVVGGVDISDPDAVGPAELDVWTRFNGAPDDVLTGQVCLAYATDGFCIGTAMRPHAGVGQSQAHVTLSTGVITHTLTFHEPFSAAEWMLMANRSPYAGHGRGYGRADIFSQDGSLLASFVQDSMIRRIPEGRTASAL